MTKPASGVKTTWTAKAGTMTFMLSDRNVHEFPVATIDHPVTLCQVLDVVAGLSPSERRAVIAMVTGIELRRLNVKRERR